MCPHNSMLETEFRRFGRRDIACPVDVEHPRQNYSVNRLVLGNEPAEVVAQPGEVGYGFRCPLLRKPIEPSGHVGATAATKLPNTAVTIDGGPQRIFVIDMVREAERDGIIGNVRCRLDKRAKGAYGHDGIYGRDHCRRTEQPLSEDLEAR